MTHESCGANRVLWAPERVVLCPSWANEPRVEHVIGVRPIFIWGPEKWPMNGKHKFDLCA
jgi:hypothetical protein